MNIVILFFKFLYMNKCKLIVYCIVVINVSIKFIIIARVPSALVSSVLVFDGSLSSPRWKVEFCPAVSESISVWNPANSSSHEAQFKSYYLNPESKSVYILYNNPYSVLTPLNISAKIVPNECGDPPTIDNGRESLVVTNRTSLYQCTQGYVMEGSSHVFCGNSSWGAPPRCVLEDVEEIIKENVEEIIKKSEIEVITEIAEIEPSVSSQPSSKLREFGFSTRSGGVNSSMLLDILSTALPVPHYEYDDYNDTDYGDYNGSRYDDYYPEESAENLDSSLDNSEIVPKGTPEEHEPTEKPGGRDSEEVVKSKGYLEEYDGGTIYLFITIHLLRFIPHYFSLCLRGGGPFIFFSSIFFSYFKIYLLTQFSK